MAREGFILRVFKGGLGSAKWLVSEDVNLGGSWKGGREVDGQVNLNVRIPGHRWG